MLGSLLFKRWGNFPDLIVWTSHGEIHNLHPDDASSSQRLSVYRLVAVQSDRFTQASVSQKSVNISCWLSLKKDRRSFFKPFDKGEGTSKIFYTSWWKEICRLKRIGTNSLFAWNYQKISSSAWKYTLTNNMTGKIYLIKKLKN